MVLSFADYFWGQKNNGFEVLYHNMKHGQLSSKEFSEFLKESCNVEESYAKALGRLAKYAGNNGAHGSFSPYWQVLKSLAERLSTLHLQIVHSWQDLMKDVHRYTDEQHKKHKSIKETESSTLETVHCIQQTIASLHKAKEVYQARCLDFERLKRENASPKDLEKAETKYKKANDDYKGLVDKYANVRNDFETKMLESCKKFQEVEENHLRQMKDFVDTYAKAWETQHERIGQLHVEIRDQSEKLTVDTLLETFIHNKTTGTEKPGPIEFEETDLSALPPASTPTEGRDKEGTPTEKPKQGFLRKNRTEKKKDKKKKKKDKDKDEDGGSEKSAPMVDEEGYSIRPENPQGRILEHNTGIFHQEVNSWYSSSDSDSDTEEKSRKLKVEIKPLNSPSDTASGTVDDIKQSMEGLRISPNSSRRQTPVNETMKRSISVTEQMNSGKPSGSQDLLGLDLFGGTSSASTPTGAIYDFPPSRNSLGGSSATTPVSPHDILGNGPEVPPLLPAKQRSQTPTILHSLPRSQTPTLLPGPPLGRQSRSKLPPAVSTNMSLSRPAGRMSPSPAFSDRTDSPGGQSSIFSTTSMPVGSSRGPSPLTLGMADTVPLAVAFSETANAIYKGSDDSACRLKLTGDMLLSFPAGIVRALMDNPNPAMLSFRIRNASRLEQVLVNRQLVTQDESQSIGDSLVYSFNMSSLSEHLRRQSEQNKAASHFNIDILKYQIKCGPDRQHAPLHLSTSWKCEPGLVDFCLNYQYNSAAISSHQALSNVSIYVPVQADVANMQAQPTATWSAESKRAIWKLGEVSDMKEDGGQGSLQAKFDLSSGTARPSTIAAQFMCEGSTMSGIDFELVGTGYRTSLIKKRFVSGKYICDPVS